jgi:hypothetical protein
MWDGFPAVTVCVPELLYVEGGTRDGLYASGQHWTPERLADIVRQLEPDVPSDAFMHAPSPLAMFAAALARICSHINAQK